MSKHHPPSESNLVLGRCGRWLLVLIAAAALAAWSPHGGSLKGGAAGKGGKKGGKPPSVTGAGGTGAGMPAAQPTGPASAGSASGARSPRGNPGTRRPGGPSTGAGSIPQPAVYSQQAWEVWWHRNEDRWLDLRARLQGQAPASGGFAPLSGLGRHERGGSRRAAEEQVARDIVPVLLELLAGSDEPEVLDSALIALGRCADEAAADDVLASVRPLLAHDVLSVQTSAVLALGVHGSPRAVPLLGALMADTTEGRRAVGGGEIHEQVRSLAALSLGLGNHPSAVPLLADLVVNLPDAERDLKVCAITALGLAANEAGDAAFVTLAGLLRERRLDALPKSHVPLALARLDGGARSEAVPVLREAFAHRDTDDLVRVACASALGRLASVTDAPVLDALIAEAADGRHSGTRQASLMALAEIGLRDLPTGEQHAAAHDRLATCLSAGLRGDGRDEDRPWHALATGLYSSGRGRLAPQLAERLAAGHADVKDPSSRGAFALALGLAGAESSAPDLIEDFTQPGDPLLRGYSAVALGLLAAPGQSEALLKECVTPNTEPLLRENAAVALALLGDRDVVPALLGALESVEVHEASLSIARSLGRIGDRAAIPDLVRIARDTARQPSTRGMAVVALGLLGERGLLPWNAPLKELDTGLARVPSLDNVLDIL